MININDHLEHYPCPICSSKDFKVLRPSHYPHFDSIEEICAAYSSSSDHTLMDQLVECKQCNLIYINPVISPEIIQKGYKEAVDPLFVSQNKYRIDCFKKALRNIQRHTQMQPGDKLLDVGCAGGAYLKAAKDLNYLPIGVELSTWMCDYAQKTYGVDARNTTFLGQKFPDENFDLVSFWDVLEHVHDPGAQLAEANRVLKKNGHIILTYPDAGSTMAKILGYKWPFYLSVHLTYYTRETIVKQLEKAGFQKVHIASYWQSLALGYLIFRGLTVLNILPSLGKWCSQNAFLNQFSITYNMGQTFVIGKKV